MQPYSRSIFDIFDGKKRYVVPLFQRQYVWSKEAQWEPLWEDIRRKHAEQVKERKGPPHFLGAMVIDQKRVFGNQVPAHLVIDGQQRLTTFQIFLAAFRDLCAVSGHETYAEECHRYLENTGIMANPDEERFKVWPSNLDRDQFKAIVSSRSKEEVEKCFPLVRRKWSRKPDPRPRMIECYLYFYSEIGDYLKDEFPELPIEQKVAKLFQTLGASLQVVTIELEGDDDPQVIFETLNARGEPLLPSDLLRNYTFWRAAQQHEPQEKLYNQYWLEFDTDFWRQEERQGRLNRPRLDIFLQHYLAFKTQDDINIGHLFSEYKYWITSQKPFPSIEEELRELVEHRDYFRKFIEPDQSSRLGRFAYMLSVFDTRTIYPLLLGILDLRLPETLLQEFMADLESYIIRRAICGMTAKNYNRLFISILPKLSPALDRNGLRSILMEMQGDSAVWPRDEEFRQAWLNKPIYDVLGSARTQAILRAIEDQGRQAKSEVVDVRSPLTIEHVMPEEWIENWPLPNGRPGIPWGARESMGVAHEDVVASAKRDELKHTFGNLTLLTQPLNSAVSNASYDEKRPEILKNSALALNRYFQDQMTWDEETIITRGEALFSIAKEVWPHGM